jgi:asparagine synthase (glutamine-hydrolysing)
MIPAPWFHPDFVRRNHAALCGYPSRVKLFGALPSFQHNIATLEVLRRTLVHLVFPSNFLREVRFPYLDRDLMEFMYAIPREQLVRVGQRRSLMKRALSGIVPNELLTRRQKAVVPQEPRKHVSTEWPNPVEIDQHMVSSSIGIIDRNRFLEALQKARLNEKVPVRMLERTLTLESWLRHLTIQGVLRNSMPTKRPGYSSLGARELTTSVQPKSSAS